jgi:GT2 family glycosyltransferase
MKISIITLSWDNRSYTEAFVKSIRSNTSLTYELIIVDNGSKKETQQWVRKIADKCIIFDSNQGFPKGFNEGIKIATGEYLLLANNDTEFPENWDKLLVDTMEKNPNAGIVSPVYTNGRRIARRIKPGKKVIKVGRFKRGPSGVAYFMRRKEMIKTFGMWCEDYAIASGEDADLCMTVWDKNFDILIDERVLIFHEGKVTSSTKLNNWKDHFSKNGKQFRKKWFFKYYFPYLARIIQKFKYY